MTSPSRRSRTPSSPIAVARLLLRESGQLLPQAVVLCPAALATECGTRGLDEFAGSALTGLNMSIRNVTSAANLQTQFTFWTQTPSASPVQAQLRPQLLQPVVLVFRDAASSLLRSAADGLTLHARRRSYTCGRRRPHVPLRALYDLLPAAEPRRQTAHRQAFSSLRSVFHLFVRVVF